MLKIPAGASLDALVAEHVMEWKRLPNCDALHQGDTCNHDQVPSYSRDWNCIKPVAEKLRGENFVLRTNMSMDGYGATFHRGWETGAISGLTVTSYADDLAHAVCLAALEAKGYRP